MGADIHMKTYVWSKIENKYIDAYSLCDNLTIMMREYHSGEFPELVGDRFYDLFDLFGGRRSNTYDELTCLKYGVPDFIIGTTFDKLLEDRESGYFGYSWCYYPDFKNEITEYIKRLSDPEKYLDHESDLYLDWKSNPDDPNVKLQIQDMEESNGYLSKELNNIIEKLKFYDHILVNDDCSYESEMGKLIDVDKTIFLFWFDN